MFSTHDDPVTRVCVEEYLGNSKYHKCATHFDKCPGCKRETYCPSCRRCDKCKYKGEPWRLNGVRQVKIDRQLMEAQARGLNSNHPRHLDTSIDVKGKFAGGVGGGVRESGKSANFHGKVVRNTRSKEGKLKRYIIRPDGKKVEVETTSGS